MVTSHKMGGTERVGVLGRGMGEEMVGSRRNHVEWRRQRVDMCPPMPARVL